MNTRRRRLTRSDPSRSRVPPPSSVLRFLPLAKRLLLIIWPFLAILVLLVVLATQSMAILAAGRAYVEGESLWSKAQKQALSHLMRGVHW